MYYIQSTSFPSDGTLVQNMFFTTESRRAQNRLSPAPLESTEFSEKKFLGWFPEKGNQPKTSAIQNTFYCNATAGQFESNRPLNDSTQNLHVSVTSEGSVRGQSLFSYFFDRLPRTLTPLLM
jgi:hypothetical protein